MRLEMCIDQPAVDAATQLRNRPHAAGAQCGLPQCASLCYIWHDNQPCIVLLMQAIRIQSKATLRACLILTSCPPERHGCPPQPAGRGVTQSLTANPIAFAQ